MKRLLAGALSLLILLSHSPGLQAQDAGPMMQKEPPMRNVFFNVLWGSMAGGMVYMSISILDSNKTKSEKYAFSALTKQFIVGATGGGILGLGAGAYFSLTEVTFDPGQSRISHNMSLPGLPDERPSQLLAERQPLFNVNIRF